MLVYLPQLFARHAAEADAEARRRFELMERWVYAVLMTPSALATVLAGIWLIFERGFEGGWFPVKLALVVAMGLFHVYCGHMMIKLKRGGATHRPAYYRALPLPPAILVLAIVVLVTGKPF